jgi:hypothetical protein
MDGGALIAEVQALCCAGEKAPRIPDLSCSETLREEVSEIASQIVAGERIL